MPFPILTVSFPKLRLYMYIDMAWRSFLLVEKLIFNAAFYNKEMQCTEWLSMLETTISSDSFGDPDPQYCHVQGSRY